VKNSYLNDLRGINFTLLEVISDANIFLIISSVKSFAYLFLSFIFLKVFSSLFEIGEIISCSIIWLSFLSLIFTSVIFDSIFIFLDFSFLSLLFSTIFSLSIPFSFCNLIFFVFFISEFSSDSLLISISKSSNSFKYSSSLPFNDFLSFFKVLLFFATIWSFLSSSSFSSSSSLSIKSFLLSFFWFICFSSSNIISFFSIFLWGKLSSFKSKL